MRWTDSDWERKNVLVGVLHSPGQMAANMRFCFYHIPARLLPAPPGTIDYVALYQSRRFFGDQAGIRHYGRVRRWEALSRGAITELPTRNPEERYIRFSLENWLELERRILPGGVAPGIGICTALPLLHTSRCVPELYLHTESQHRIYRTLYRACRRTLHSGGSETIPSLGGHLVLVSGWTIGVYPADGSYEQWDLREFYRRPHSFLKRLSPYLAPEDRELAGSK